MAISRAQLLKELLPGLNALFGLEYAKYGEEHAQIFETESSDRSFEEETKLSGFSAAPVKDEGSAIEYDNAQEAWSARYVHETVAMGFSITEEAIEDNLYDSLSARYTKALARAMAYTKQVKAASILNNGFAAGTTYGDGQSLLSTAHPLVSGGSNSNRPTVAADLNETSLEAAVIGISQWTDERGLLIAAQPRKLIIPPALQFVATRLLDTDGRVGTAMIAEFRFTKFCERLQALIVEQLDNEFKMFCKNRGVQVESSRFSLQFNTPQNFGKFRQAEVDQVAMNVFSSIEGADYISKRFAMTRFLGLTEDEILQNEKMWREENGDTDELAGSSDTLKGVGASPAPADAGGDDFDFDETDVDDTEDGSVIDGSENAETDEEV